MQVKNFLCFLHEREDLIYPINPWWSYLLILFEHGQLRGKQGYTMKGCRRIRAFAWPPGTSKMTKPHLTEAVHSLSEEKATAWWLWPRSDFHSNERGNSNVERLPHFCKVVSALCMSVSLCFARVCSRPPSRVRVFFQQNMPRARHSYYYTTIVSPKLVV
jgi:hypothetical protein